MYIVSVVWWERWERLKRVGNMARKLFAYCHALPPPVRHLIFQMWEMFGWWWWSIAINSDHSVVLLAMFFFSFADSLIIIVLVRQLGKCTIVLLNASKSARLMFVVWESARQVELYITRNIWIIMPNPWNRQIIWSRSIHPNEVSSLKTLLIGLQKNKLWRRCLDDVDKDFNPNSSYPKWH